MLTPHKNYENTRKSLACRFQLLENCHTSLRHTTTNRLWTRERNGPLACISFIAQFLCVFYGPQICWHHFRVTQQKWYNKYQLPILRRQSTFGIWPVIERNYKMFRSVAQFKWETFFFWKKVKFKINTVLQRNSTKKMCENGRKLFEFRGKY